MASIPLTQKLLTMEKSQIQPAVIKLTVNMCAILLHFTPEQEILFARRFAENYDMVDPVYSQWLEINHPRVHVEHQNSIEEDCQLEKFIQQVVNNQGDLVQVEITNDESTGAVEPTNHSELSHEAGTSNNCGTQLQSIQMNHHHQLLWYQARIQLLLRMAGPTQPQVPHPIQLLCLPQSMREN